MLCRETSDEDALWAVVPVAFLKALSFRNQASSAGILSLCEGLMMPY
jgi:hypothetical protein